MLQKSFLKLHGRVDDDCSCDEKVYLCPINMREYDWGIRMRYDLHCHTKEGSIDGRLGIVPYALMLRQRGYSGMLITDHDSYRGYQYYMDMKKYDKLPGALKNFVVLKGVEYDTSDAGHVIIVLPDGVDCPLFEKKGLKLEKLEKIVHKLGGIMGAAHPYGNGYIAITNTRLYKKNHRVVECFDFIEVYNSTLNKEKNAMAYALAEQLGKPMTSGSDAHSVLRAGTAYTAFETKLTCNNDLIEYIKQAKPTVPVGLFHPGLLKKKNPVIRKLGIIGYWVYNKTGMVIRTGARRKFLRELKFARK